MKKIIIPTLTFIGGCGIGAYVGAKGLLAYMGKYIQSDEFEAMMRDEFDKRFDDFIRRRN